MLHNAKWISCTMIYGRAQWRHIGVRAYASSVARVFSESLIDESSIQQTQSLQPTSSHAERPNERAKYSPRTMHLTITYRRADRFAKFICNAVD